ncbi:hypothetical protein [Roseovarius salinarum]|uniref:hypothetical protein n=1 Tax=Roseovarius salinarum TaxID=1981892 RepID=UPI000C349C55|nr:hypothetical protein [Roseovarius salinarum]
MDAKTILEGIEAALLDKTEEIDGVVASLQEAAKLATSPAARNKIQEAIDITDAAGQHSVEDMRQFLLNYVMTAKDLVSRGR